ncbi:MAG TPA: MFS transporter [Polyangia bacterium]|jgi:multidrug resistance protein|nr:MFS transporter [Polyangia bacterium]
MSSPFRSRLGVIFLTVFLDLLGFGMVIPILPLYAERLHATDLEIGRLLAIYSVMQLVFAPIWGRVSDRIGRRPVLLVSILGSCGSQLGYALAPSYVWLVVARGFAGLCGANISAAQAYVADVTDERSRAAGMGRLGAALGLGFIFGPAIGGLLAHFGPRTPFFVASALAAINFLLAFVILSEPRQAGERAASRVLTWSGLVRTLSTPRLLVLILLYFLVTFGFSNLEATFSLFLKRRFGYDQRGASMLFVFIGAIMVVMQGMLVPRLVSRVGERTLVIGGTLLMSAGMAVQCVAHQVPVLLIAVALVATGSGINTPSMSSLISRAAGDQQGGVLGVTQSFGALGRIIGPLFGTWALGFGLAMPYAAAGLLIMLACLVAATLVRQPETRPAAAPVGSPQQAPG